MGLKNQLYKLIIIGSGPAGYTAAIYAARANLKPLLITGLQKGGQLIQTDKIENWPGRFKLTTGYDLMHDMEQHALSLQTNIIYDQVIDVDFSKKKFQIYCEKEKYISLSVIIATGSSPRYLGLPEEKELMGKGISTCATCDGFFYKSQEVAVVGGGNTAIEEALYLSNIASKVHIIHRREIFTAEKILIDRLNKKIEIGNIVLHTNFIISKIIKKKKNIVEIEMNCTKNIYQKKTISIQALFIAIGSIPNTKIFYNKIEMENGYIKIQKKIKNINTQTNIPGVFAAGDVVDHIYKQAITSAASGCMAALDAEKYLNKINSIKSL
ncbi:thioredoxin-disulfide reductase [Buchnera aphidicola]|uniref:Thioredoxin reductase n=1 Tax=Buchnera aphidicola (Sarucallis kahawaluokalani) TaxID=1241878 RepID=A0A4D6Y9F2_9GAMM|nr:thioredoxin-disulfide reductase [Buchnera aphidicola]QCI26009.1 thioredoxin-disulfide reductase [Buchnera aphidicola (Sarucallis kahawaluokalani)]